MKVQQILKCKDGECLITVNPETKVIDALKIMADFNIGSVVVVENGTLVGIFTERDYARKGVLEGRVASETLMKEVMTKRVLTVAANDKLEDCIKIMSENHIRHLPVVDGLKPIGMISVNDILNALLNEQKNRIASLEHYITGSPVFA